MEAHDSQAGDSERSKGFVKSTNHDAPFAMPCGSRAAMAKGGTGIPNQEGKSQGPENGIESIQREIDL